MTDLEDDRRRDTRKPIRLKVVYRNARALVTEFTTSVSKAGCLIRTERPLPVGTRFVFEMYAQGDAVALEVEGRVAWCAPAGEPGMHEVAIEYLPAEGKRKELEHVLERIFTEHKWERARRDPRIPVNLVAFDGANPAHHYLVRDISRGGAGLRLPAGEKLAANLRPGCRFELLVKHDGDVPFELAGVVVWTTEGRPGFTRSALGLRFEPVREDNQRLLDALTHLHRPQALTIRFG